LKRNINVCHFIISSQLQELLAQSRHYSEKSRKHALTGLVDLFKRNPGELKRNIAEVVAHSVERIADDDKFVRQQLKVLLREAILVQVDQEVLRPFLPIIMAHITG
jgi:pre-rRNA-processing protein IPI1